MSQNYLVSATFSRNESVSLKDVLRTQTSLHKVDSSFVYQTGRKYV